MAPRKKQPPLVRDLTRGTQSSDDPDTADVEVPLVTGQTVSLADLIAAGVRVYVGDPDQERRGPDPDLEALADRLVADHPGKTIDKLTREICSSENPTCLREDRSGSAEAYLDGGKVYLVREDADGNREVQKLSPRSLEPYLRDARKRRSLE